MSSALDYVRYSCGIAGEEVANRVDDLSQQVFSDSELIDGLRKQLASAQARIAELKRPDYSEMREMLRAMQAGELTVSKGIEILEMWSAGNWNDNMLPPVRQDLIEEDSMPVEIIDRLRKQLASAQAWQPIETAPRDVFVLLAGPSGYTTIETVFATGRMCSDYRKGRWIDHANDDLTDWGFVPTHWMPLPAAPGTNPTPQPAALADDVVRDAELLDYLESLVLESRTGVSIDFTRFVEDGLVTEKGFRLASFHTLRDRYPSLRAAIAAAKGEK